MFKINRLSLLAFSIVILASCGGSGGGDGGSDSGDTDTNSVPEITSANSISVQENIADTGYVLTATDSDGDSISFSISGGADAALFNIDATTGELSFLVAPSFSGGGDNSYLVTLQASDGEDIDSLTLTVTVTEDIMGLNVAPEITSASSASVTESLTDTGYTLTATDADGDPITFSISGGADAALFDIDGTTGDLSFLVAPEFDDAGDNEYEVVLQASDGSDTDTLAVTISVTEEVIVESLGITDIDLRDPDAPLVADFYAPEPLIDKMSKERVVSWDEINTVPDNLTRFSFGVEAGDDVFALTDAGGSIDPSLAISTDLALDTEVTYDLLLRSMFQFFQVAPGSDRYAIYSTKHGNYALDVADDGESLILRDVRSLSAYSAGSGAFLTFELGTSPMTLVTNGRYLFDPNNETNDTLVFNEDPDWNTNMEVALVGTDLELVTIGSGTSMNLYAATIGLEIPADFNPQQIPRFDNLEYYETNQADPNDRIDEDFIPDLQAQYAPQVTSQGINAGTLSAAEAMLDDIEEALAAQGSQLRYPREFYLALRDGMLRRELLVEESNDGEIGELTVPYVYFTNEEEDGSNHPFMVIATHGVPDALALLGDVPHPPGNGVGDGYDNQNVTRSYFMENFLLGIPMRDYGEVATPTENELVTHNTINSGISLADDFDPDNPPPPYDHHNYASTNESAVAVDGVVVFPSYNASLNFSQEPGELSVRGIHSGRGLGAHYHADPHSAAFTDTGGNTDTGLNLYNEGDYEGRNHPPIISIGFDGVAGYGFYLDDDTSDGVNVALDDFGGHEHDDYGYHYHSFRTPRQVGGNAYETHELGPLGAWAGRIIYLPDFRPRNNTRWIGR